MTKVGQGALLSGLGSWFSSSPSSTSCRQPNPAPGNATGCEEAGTVFFSKGVGGGQASQGLGCPRLVTPNCLPLPSLLRPASPQILFP